jgi:hypothetical protein
MSAYLSLSLTALLVFTSSALCQNTDLKAHEREALHSLLQTFRPCYTEVIFVRKLVDFDIPESPILISTSDPSLSMGDQKKCLQVSDPYRYGPYLPEFTCFNNTDSLLIKIRLNCVALVILQSESVQEIEQAIQYHHFHSWIHVRRIEYVQPKLTNSVSYYKNLFVNALVGNELFEGPVWKLASEIVGHQDYKPRFPMFLIWRAKPGSRSRGIDLRIKLTPPCIRQLETRRMVFEMDGNLTILNLEALYRQELVSSCTGTTWLALDRHERLDTSYIGPPLDNVSPKSYLKSENRRNVTYEMILISILASALSNTSIYVVDTDSIKVRVDRKNEILNIKNHISNIEVSTSMSDIGHTLNWETGGQYLPISSSSYGFLNCEASANQPLSFQGFLKPFQPKTWLFFGVTACGSLCFFFALIRLKKMNYDQILLFYSYLLEHGYHLSRRLRTLRPLSVFLALFLLMSIVLSNGLVKYEYLLACSIQILGLPQCTFTLLINYQNTCSEYGVHSVDAIGVTGTIIFVFVPSKFCN